MPLLIGRDHRGGRLTDPAPANEVNLLVHGVEGRWRNARVPSLLVPDEAVSHLCGPRHPPGAKDYGGLGATPQGQHVIPDLGVLIALDGLDGRLSDLPAGI